MSDSQNLAIRLTDRVARNFSESSVVHAVLTCVQRLALSLHPNDSRWNHVVSKAQEVERERLGVYLCRKHCQPIRRNDGGFEENSLGLSASPCSKKGKL